MKIQGIALGVLMAGALSVAVAQAEEKVAGAPARVARDGFAAIDTDGNGTLSLEEFKAMVAKKHEARKLKEGEAAKPAPNAEETFAKLDTDKSGGLSKEEMAAGHKGPRDGQKREARKAAAPKAVQE
jgi:Ca2+-binding EF-hand superfamily protein